MFSCIAPEMILSLNTSVRYSRNTIFKTQHRSLYHKERYFSIQSSIYSINSRKNLAKISNKERLLKYDMVFTFLIRTKKSTLIVK